MRDTSLPAVLLWTDKSSFQEGSSENRQGGALGSQEQNP